MKFVDFRKDKKPGFWVSASLALLSMVIAIVYIACFRGTDEMSYWAFSFLLIGGILGLGLLAFNKSDIAKYVIGGGIFVALLFYIYAVYYYVSVVMVGIDLDHFSTEFIITTTLFVIGFIGGLVNVFLPQVKTAEIESTESEEK